MSETVLAADRRYLWALCYRMTGCAADADDVTQEVFRRALESPPARPGPWRPWLVRVAVNLCRDLLRRRRREAAGTWLPGPIEDDDPALSAVEPVPTEHRYELLESVSFAFLLALEALTPAQRAVLLLRDVFDRSVHEVATCLGRSETNVKVIHHRARRVLERYDRERLPARPEAGAEAGRLLAQLLAALTAGDGAAAEQLLSADARLLSDSGREFHAARVPVVGRDRIAAFLQKLAHRRGLPDRVELRPLNGVPSVVATYDGPVPTGEAPRFVMLPELGPDGRLRAIYTVLQTRKLTAVRA